MKYLILFFSSFVLFACNSEVRDDSKNETVSHYEEPEEKPITDEEKKVIKFYEMYSFQ